MSFFVAVFSKKARKFRPSLRPTKMHKPTELIIKILEKYFDSNDEYYSQEKKYHNSEDTYKSYIEKNILPYNE